MIADPPELPPDAVTVYQLGGTARLLAYLIVIGLRPGDYVCPKCAGSGMVLHADAHVEFHCTHCSGSGCRFYPDPQRPA